MYTLMFSRLNSSYRIHTDRCKHAVSTNLIVAVDNFNTAADATSFAHADESEKAGYLVSADVKTCNCAKGG